MAKRRSQFEHDSLVEMLADGLYSKDLKDIRADYTGFNQPEKLTLADTGESYLPDITAVGKQFLIYEVETADSIFDSHTEKQWRFFAAYAADNDAVFCVVVPPMCVVDARNRLNQLSITATVLTVP